MNHGKGSWASLFRNLLQRPASRRRVRDLRRGRRFESLEHRLMLHGGEDHGINGPHDADPNYNLSGFDISFQLAIYVDGQEVDIPVWGGQSGGDSINPVNTNGLIRIHPTSARSSYVTLDEVLQAWRTAPANGNANAQLSSSNLLGNHVDSEHYIRMFVNGTRVSALEDYQIHANDSVVLAYTSNPIVTVETNLGLVPIELFRDRTPITVANFLNYVNDGDYNDSFFHRFLPNFVLQGGGFKTTTNTFADPTVVNQFTSVTTDAQIQNEFDNWAKVSGTAASITNGNALIHLGAGIDLSTVAVGDRIRLTGRTDGINDTDMFDVVGVSDVNDTVTVQQTPAGGSTNNVAWKIFPEVNLTGTLAMAKVGGNPNSATSQFFINLNDNDASLDMQNGGFTVFGQILDHTVLQDIAALNDLSLFSIVLNGQQQVPPVTTSASGAGILAFNKLVNEFDLSLDVAGIPSGDLTGSHIHKGSAGVNGDIVIDLGSGSTYTQAGNQQLRRVIDDGILPALNVSDLQLNGLYVNVHTTANSDGEIRGQLTSLQSGLYSDLPTTSTDDLIVMQSFSGEAEIRGNVFIDADEDGVRDQNETGRSNFAVFADDNQNNQLDPGEATATTDNNGNYTLRVAPGLHHVRIVPAAGVAQTSPSGVYSVTVEIGDQLTGRDFGTFGIAAPTAIDLVSATDSGSSTIDNVTNYNNNGANRALQFQVTGVRDGALVRIRADGILIGETTVPANSGGTVIVTTDGTTTLSEGLRNIVATQAFGGATSEATAALGVNIDVSIASFTSTPPTTAMVGTELTYNAENADEGQANFVYSLNNAPSGAVINPSTGTLAWTPAANQSGHHEFEVVATDNAGNTRTQAIELDATKNPQVRVRLEVTDLNGNPLSQINVGSTFQLRAFVTDVRMDVPDNQKGVFSLYQDVTFNNSLATATSITHDTIMFGNSSAGTISGGLLDEIGSFSGRISPPGATESLLYTVTLTAVRSGTLTFTGDPADLIPAHQVGLFGNDDPIPLDEVDFGRDSIQIINPNFQITDDQFNFNEDTTANSLNVLTNDQGPQGSTLQIVSVGTTSNGGTVTIASDNRSLIYTPAANFFGNETFTYTVSDGSDEGVATVTVQVQPVNDAPTAVNDAFTVTEDTTNNSLAVLQNDLVTPDASTEKLKVLSVTQPAHGVVTIDSAGLVVRYTPNNDYRGTDTFTYTIQDDGNPALTSTATATVTVVSDNDPPTAVNDNVTVLEDSQNNVFDVLANDTIAPDTGETLTITTVTSGSRGGTVTVTQNGTRINYTPAANVFGEESFTYTISDGNGGTAVGTVRVTITPQNDAPNGVNDALSVAKNSQNNLLQVLNNDTITPDADETLTITAVSQGSQGGSLQIAEDGTRIGYTPVNNFLGTETFTYTVRDPGGLTDTATVTVTVRDFVPSSVSGFVYVDTDSDGIKDSGELAIANVQIALTGTDDFGGTVSLQATTDANGFYQFTSLAPGSYKLKETQPTGQINGQDIQDGQDTVGSQGGAVTANDELTFELNENVTGTNNNFGELTGYRLEGLVLHSANSEHGTFLSGLEVQLYAANAQQAATGSALKTAQLQADGTFQFEGLASGSYVVKPTNPMFLAFNDTEQFVTLSNANSINEVSLTAARQGRYISYRDFLNSTPRQGMFAAVNLTSRTQLWTALDSSWSGFTSASVVPTSDSSALKLDLTRTTGEQVTLTIPLNDPRIYTIAQDGANRLYRITGPSTSYNFTTVSTGAGEGESATALMAMGSSASTLGSTDTSYAATSTTTTTASSGDSASASSTMGGASVMDAGLGAEGEGAASFAFLMDTLSSGLANEDDDTSATSTTGDEARAGAVDQLLATDELAQDDELLDSLAAARTADDTDTGLLDGLWESDLLGGIVDD